MLTGVQDEVIEQAEDVEDRDEADRVRTEDEEEQREDQGRPCADPLPADVRLHDVVAHEFHERLERVHDA